MLHLDVLGAVQTKWPTKMVGWIMKDVLKGNHAAMCKNTQRDWQHTHTDTPHTYQQLRKSSRHLLKGQKETENFHYGWGGGQPHIHVCRIMLQGTTSTLLYFQAPGAGPSAKVTLSRGACLAYGGQVFTLAVKAVCVRSHPKVHTCSNNVQTKTSQK